MSKPEAITAKQAYTYCDESVFDFKKTDELTETKHLIGQDRVTTSLDFGVNIKHQGYNIFALGPDAINKREVIESYLNQNVDRSVDEKLQDICYVNNFDEQHQPRALTLPPGMAEQLRVTMEKLIQDLPSTLTTAFESEEYQNRRQSIEQEVKEEQSQTFENIQEKARQRGLALVRSPAGFTIAPVDENGEVMSAEQVQQLDEEKRKEIEQNTQELQQDLQKVLQQMPAHRRKVRERLEELDKEVAEYAIRDLIREIKQKFEGVEAVQKYIEDVKNDIIENARLFIEQQDGNQMMAMMGQSGGGQQAAMQQEALMRRYQVNVLVSHEKTEKLPVVYEDNPNYKNLIGRVEYQSQMGALTTDFNLIKPGSLHKANGGYLIMDARKVLTEPFAWDGLKRALKSGKLKIESPMETHGLISTVTLEPEPIDLDVKVILLGERMLYYLLCQYDPEFKNLFKVEADFEDEIDRTPENHKLYAQLIAGLANRNKLLPLDRSAVARVIERSSRWVSDSEKMGTQIQGLEELLQEANYWAKKRGVEVIERQDIQSAINHHDYRSGRLRDKVQESINRELVYIDTEGSKVGQINGLSVLMIGNNHFGRPNRITAKVRLGKGEVIDIEREVDMSGPIHSKGVMILSGFLGERFATQKPLSLSASLVFEQSYGGIDGDSASSAELYTLLSAIAQLPLKQSLAVTGSVNQHGEIQPVGGVNEKIEGFFDICNYNGLTGEQGVLLPESNVKHLMLREDVLEAIKENKFHIYPVQTVDQGIELLTGLPMGERDDKGEFPENTVSRMIDDRLNKMNEYRMAFAPSQNGKTSES